MKIKVDRDKLVRAFRKIEGIELVVENEQDAKEALDVILKRSGIFDTAGASTLQDVLVTSLEEYSDSAVSYKKMFVLDFIFTDDVPIDTRISLIKQFQDQFGKV